MSIVVPSYNRFNLLVRCIDKIRQNVHEPREVIVVDGGSTDGSRPWLARQSDLSVIPEETREGVVRALNKGFRTASGEYVMWLNDDAYPLPGAVETAVAMMERTDLPELGMVGFYHRWHSDRNILDRVVFNGSTYCFCHVRGYPYANFGLLRRALLERIGFLDERYFFFGFDPDLSLTLQLREGLKVLGCRSALLAHDEHLDQRKREDLPVGYQDNERLFAKWKLPAPGAYPDPAPAYRRLIEQLNVA